MVLHHLLLKSLELFFLNGSSSIPRNSSNFLLQVFSCLHTRSLGKAEQRERKLEQVSWLPTQEGSYFLQGNLCTSLWLCPLHRASEPSTFLATAQGPGAWQCLLARERMEFHPSLHLLCWGFIYNKDMSKHDCKNYNRSPNVYIQHINTFSLKKLYNCSLQKIIINKIYVKIWYPEGSDDQWWQPCFHYIFSQLGLCKLCDTLWINYSLWSFEDKVKSKTWHDWMMLRQGLLSLITISVYISTTDIPPKSLCL